MTVVRLKIFISMLAVIVSSACSSLRVEAKDESEMVTIAGGIYRSFFPEAPAKGLTPVPPEISVREFKLDRHPVTNRQFLEFVTKNSKWQRGRVPALFAGDSYLKHWNGPEQPGDSAPPDSPVVHASWFAAKAYCEWKNKRLPTTVEWEYAAAPEQFKGIDSKNPETVILEWYGRPTASIHPRVGLTPPNRFGAYDLHGLVWEWTSDFNSMMTANDARDTSSAEQGLFCGAGSLGGGDPGAYATYMRMAFRSSLKGGYCLANLGFRCAR